MNALTQYIELFDSNRAMVEEGSSAAMNRLREAARTALSEAHLPQRGDEGFEKTSINDMFAPDFGVNIARVNLPVDVAATFRCDVPNMSTLLALVANDKFVPTDSLLRNLPGGVTVCSLSQALADKDSRAAEFYGKVAPLTDASAALNTLLAQDGVFIHIADGVELERPIQIVNILSSTTPLAAFRRVLVVAEEDSAASILLCDHSRNDGSAYLASQVIEVVTLAGSRIDFVDIEESSAVTARYNQLFVNQHTGSSFRATTATLLNGTSRNDFNIYVGGDRCSTGLYGMAIGGGNQHIDNSSSVIHCSKHSTSNQLFRYVLDDRSTGAFEGGIEVAPGAVMTEAYQSNNNILASAEARMHSKPQLLIYNDDVKCSHGASTGQLNAEALFYMQTRGIPAAEARTMLMQAFMVDVINTVSLEGVRDRLRHLVEKRFDGSLGLCASCLKQ